MRTKDEYQGVLILNRDELAYLKKVVTTEVNLQNHLLRKHAPLFGDSKWADPVKARAAEAEYNMAKVMLDVLGRFKTFAQLEEQRYAKA